MQNIQDIFNRIQETKSEMKEIRAAYKNALANSPEYGKIMEQYKQFRDKKKRFEDGMRASDVNFEKLEVLQKSMQSDMEMISDIALNQLVQGESVGVRDAKDTLYEPIFTVKFKKKI